MPVEAINGFGGKDFAQRLDCKCGLGAGAAVIFPTQSNRFLRRREAVARAGREGENDFGFFTVKLRERLAEQIELKIGNFKFQAGGRERQQMGFFNVGVDQNQNGIFSLGGFAEQRVNRRVWRAQTRELCAVKKARVVGDEFVELREFGNDVVGTVPIQTGAAVDADFFGGEPFHAAGKTEPADRTGQRTKTVPQERPSAAFFGKAAVVVRFAVVNVSADA